MSKIKRGFYFGVRAAKRAAGVLLKKGAKTEEAKKAKRIVNEVMKEKNVIVKDYLNQLQKSTREFVLLTQKEAERLAKRLDEINKKAPKKRKAHKKRR